MRHFKDTFLFIIILFFVLTMITGFFVVGYWIVYGSWPK